MYKKAISDFGIYGLTNFFVKLIAFSAFPIFLKYFTPTEYGLIALVSSIFQLALIISELGTFRAILRLNIEVEDKRTFYSTGILYLTLSTVFFSGLIYAIYLLFQHTLLESAGISNILIILVILTILPKQILIYNATIFRINQNTIKYGLVIVTEGILGVLLGLLAVIQFDLGINGYFLGILIGEIVLVPFVVYFSKSNYLPKVSTNQFRKIFNFGWPLVFSVLGFWIFTSSDKWMISFYKNNFEVGLYSVALKIVSVIHFMSIAFAQTWQPFIYKNIEFLHNKKAMSNLLALWFYLLIFAGILMILFASQILDLVATKEYYNSIYMVPFLSFGVVLGGIQGIASIGIFVSKRTIFGAYAAWVIAVINILLNIVLIPIYGASGAAFSSLISYFILIIVYFYLSFRLNGILFNYKSIVILSLWIPLVLVYFYKLIPFLNNAEEVLMGALILISYLLIGYVLNIHKIIIKIIRKITNTLTQRSF